MLMRTVKPTGKSRVGGLRRFCTVSSSTLQSQSRGAESLKFAPSPPPLSCQKYTTYMCALLAEWYGPFDASLATSFRPSATDVGYLNH